MAQQQADVHALVVGRAVAQLRRRRGWSQRELSSRASVKQSLLCRLELGRARPAPFTSQQLAELLGFSPDALTRVVDDALDRTERALAVVSKRQERQALLAAFAVCGLAGLKGLVEVAVAAALSEEEHP